MIPTGDIGHLPHQVPVCRPTQADGVDDDGVITGFIGIPNDAVLGRSPIGPEILVIARGIASTRVNATSESCTLAPVCSTASGVPCPSIIR